MNNKIKEKRGITLIALVITVIVVLVLAGVAVSMITGEEGLFSKANHAGTEFNTASQNEAEKINSLMSELNGINGIAIQDPSTTETGTQDSGENTGIVVDRTKETNLTQKTELLGIASGYSGGSFSGNGSTAYKAFDGNEATATVTSNSYTSRVGDYWQWMFSEKVILTRIKTVGWEVEAGGSYNNTQFKRALYITTDGTNWTQIYLDNEYVSQTATDTFEYIFETPVEVIGVKFECNDVPTSSWNYKIYEAYIYGVANDSDGSYLITRADVPGTASGYSGGSFNGNSSVAYRAFDENTATNTSTSDSYSSRVGDYWQFIFSKDVTLTRIKTLGWRVGTGGGYNNTQFKRSLYITTDGASWTQLYLDDEFVTQIELDFFEYKFENPTVVKGVKFECNNVAAHTWNYMLNEAFMFGWVSDKD